MKVHLPEQEGQTQFGLREVKPIQGGLRLKASNSFISKNDNCYIDLENDEIQLIIEAYQSSTSTIIKEEKR